MDRKKRKPIASSDFGKAKENIAGRLAKLAERSPANTAICSTYDVATGHAKGRPYTPATSQAPDNPFSSPLSSPIFSPKNQGKPGRDLSSPGGQFKPYAAAANFPVFKGRTSAPSEGKSCSPAQLSGPWTGAPTRPEKEEGIVGRQNTKQKAQRADAFELQSSADSTAPRSTEQHRSQVADARRRRFVEDRASNAAKGSAPLAIANVLPNEQHQRQFLEQYPPREGPQKSRAGDKAPGPLAEGGVRRATQTIASHGIDRLSNLPGGPFLTLICGNPTSSSALVDVSISREAILHLSPNLKKGISTSRFKGKDNEIGFIKLEDIYRSVGTNLGAWFEGEALHFNVEDQDKDETARRAIVQLSGLAHIFDITELQNAAMSILWIAYVDQKLKVTGHDLSAMWKCTLKGCPARNLLLRIASMMLSTMKQNSQSEISFTNMTSRNEEGNDWYGSARQLQKKGLGTWPRIITDKRVIFKQEEIPVWKGFGSARIYLRDPRLPTPREQGVNLAGEATKALLKRKRDDEQALDDTRAIRGPQGDREVLPTANRSRTGALSLAASSQVDRVDEERRRVIDLTDEGDLEITSDDFQNARVSFLCTDDRVRGVTTHLQSKSIPAATLRQKSRYFREKLSIDIKTMDVTIDTGRVRKAWEPIQLWLSGQNPGEEIQKAGGSTRLMLSKFIALYQNATHFGLDDQTCEGLREPVRKTLRAAESLPMAMRQIIQSDLMDLVHEVMRDVMGQREVSVWDLRRLFDHSKRDEIWCQFKDTGIIKDFWWDSKGKECFKAPPKDYNGPGGFESG